MKIVYCLCSIRGLSGVNKVTIQKVNALADIPNNQIYVIVTDDSQKHPLLDPISEKVHFINLHINYFKYDYKSRFHLFLTYFKCFKHLIALQKQINLINPDIIISVSSFEKYVIPFLKTNAVKIRELHVCSNHRSFEGKSRILTRIVDFIDYRIFTIGFHKVVLLTKEDKDTFFPRNNKFTYMHNLLTCNRIEKVLSHRKKIVISVGRLHPSKDFKGLINVWSKVCAEINDWQLYIIGDGSEKSKLEERVKELGLVGKVILPGFSNEVQRFMCEASIFAFTSKHEGFGLVITEAMNAGLPVVSYAFQFGPKDIITDGKNGFLIENGNEEKMAERIIELIKNPQERLDMSQKAYKRAEDFTTDKLIQKWMILFQTEIARRKV